MNKMTVSRSVQKLQTHASYELFTNGEVFFHWRYVIKSTYADNVALPSFARRTPLLQQSIDISCPPGPQQQTCSSGFAFIGSTT